MTHDEREVVKRAQRGDVAAFESLYHAHASMVLALCRRMTGDNQAARELVQDVFVRAWERLASFRGQSAFGTWLHRLAVNVVLERLRSDKRRPLATIDEVSLIPTRHEAGASSDARMDIETALSRLPHGSRQIYLLYDVYGYSHDEIAAMLGISAATARVQLWRARRAMLKVLGS